MFYTYSTFCISIGKNYVYLTTMVTFRQFSRWLYRRLGLSCIYFSLVFYLVIYVLLLSVSSTLNRSISDFHFPFMIPFRNPVSPTTSPQPQVTTLRTPFKSYYTDFKRYPLSIDFQELVQRKLKSASEMPNIKPINPHPFKYIHKPKQCNLHDEPRVLVLVKSAAWNKHLRDLVRNTWGLPYAKSEQVKVVFMLALSDSKTQLSIDEEAFIHKDIIQEDFYDDYMNNTYKTIMGFTWAAEFCQNARFVIFLDDDFYLNVPELFDFLGKLPSTVIPKLFLGNIIPCGEPYRLNTSRWYVPYEEYPFDYWPPYLVGGSYIVSHVVARKFSVAFPYIQSVRIDDAYVGIVAKKLSIRPIDDIQFHSGRVRKINNTIVRRLEEILHGATVTYKPLTGRCNV